MPSKRPPVDKRSISKRDLDRLPKFQEGGFAGSVLNRLLPSEQRKIEETAKYYDTYNDLVAKYNKDLEDYKSLYAKAEEDYKRSFADYQTKGQEFQRTQVDPYNAAVAQYQQQLADYQGKAKAYDEQALAAQAAYDKQYGDYQRAYDEYARQFADYETQFGQFQPQVQAAQSQLDAYQGPYAQDLRNLESSSNYYNYVYNDIYSKYMRRADDYTARAQRMREDPFWMMYEGQFGRTPESYDQLAGGLRSQAEVVIPDINRAAEEMEKYQGNLQRAGFSFDQYNNLVNNLNAVAAKAPKEPTLGIQAPVLDIKPFTEQAPTFTREAPVFTLQEPEFNFTATSPTAPKTPEMNPEELQAYQERAQKMAGYRASGLEKAFEMGMLPEIAQYFKRGVM